MPVRLRFNYQAAPHCSSRRLSQTTCRLCWSNSVSDSCPSREKTDSSGHDLEIARALIRKLFSAALQAVEPARAVRDTLAWRDGCLIVGEKSLPATNRVHVMAVGKAAVAMTQGALEAVNG